MDHTHELDDDLATPREPGRLVLAALSCIFETVLPLDLTSDAVVLAAVFEPDHKCGECGASDDRAAHFPEGV